MLEQEDGFRSAYDKQSANLRVFMSNVEQYFQIHNDLFRSGRPIIHSIKKRMKSFESLLQKIERKKSGGREILPENLFREVTDIVGVRLLLLFQEDFEIVDNVLRNKVDEGDWVLGEQPKAYTWDPEMSRYFEKFDVAVQTKETFYTSVHYLIKPRIESPITCELQVRTLYEEIWGEVDHLINYPNPSEAIALREQLMVLSKLTGAGSRLLSSIQRSSNS